MTFNERIGKFLGDLEIFTWYSLALCLGLAVCLGLVLYFLVKVIISLLLLIPIPFGTIEKIFLAMVGKKGVGILEVIGKKGVGILEATSSILKEIGQVCADRILK